MRQVILIGFMGAGKTTVGKRLARSAGRRFVDTDLLIEEREQRKISEIFEKDGEACFRDMETALLKELPTWEEPLVIAVGGGLPVREENRRLLRELGTTVYLKASVKTLEGRLAGDQERPMLRGGGLRERIISLMEAREALYEDAAEISCVTDGKTLDQVVEELHELVL